MKKSKYLLLEKLHQLESSKLVGGFSNALSDFQGDTTKVKVNNCSGGNFKVGCGQNNSKPNNVPVQNTNCHGNCVKGCGDVDTLKTH